MRRDTSKTSLLGVLFKLTQPFSPDLHGVMGMSREDAAVVPKPRHVVFTSEQIRETWSYGRSYCTASFSLPITLLLTKSVASRTECLLLKDSLHTNNRSVNVVHVFHRLRRYLSTETFKVHARGCYRTRIRVRPRSTAIARLGLSSAQRDHRKGFVHQGLAKRRKYGGISGSGSSGTRAVGVSVRT